MEELLKQILEEMKTQTALILRITEEAANIRSTMRERSSYPPEMVRSLTDALQKLQGTPLEGIIRSAASASGISLDPQRPSVREARERGFPPTLDERVRRMGPGEKKDGE